MDLVDKGLHLQPIFSVRTCNILHLSSHICCLVSSAILGNADLGGGHQEDMIASWPVSWPCSRQLLLPSLILAMRILSTVATGGVAFRDPPLREQCVVGTIVRYMWLNPVKASIWTFSIMVGRYRRYLFVLWPPKTSLLYVKSLCLLKLLPTNLEWPAFLSFLLALCVWGWVTDFTQQTSDLAN